jgi:spore maturation protein SpmB
MSKEEFSAVNCNILIFHISDKLDAIICICKDVLSVQKFPTTRSFQLYSKV